MDSGDPGITLGVGVGVGRGVGVEVGFDVGIGVVVATEKGTMLITRVAISASHRSFVMLQPLSSGCLKI